jgi:hypothetical protein
LKVSAPGKEPPSTYWVVVSWVDPKCNLDTVATSKAIDLAGNHILSATHRLVFLLAELPTSSVKYI